MITRKWPVLVVATVLLPGCGPNEPLQFFDSLNATQDRMLDAEDKFLDTIKPAVAEQAVDSNKVKNAYKDLQDALKKAKEEAKSWKTPPGANGKKLVDSYQNYLQCREDAVKSDYTTIVETVDNAKLSKKKKADNIVLLLNEVEAREKTPLADVHDAQRVFAKEHRIKLTPPKK